MAKKILTANKLYLDDDDKSEIKKKIRQLTNKYNVREYMGELFINEIKLSIDEANAPLRETARLLGLI